MAFRQLPTASRRIGFSMETPAQVEVQPHDTVVRCREREADGRPVGELEVEVFQAALVIDRDGILEEKLEHTADRAAPPGAQMLQPVPVELPGASGYRTDIEVVPTVGGGPRPLLPYVCVLAIAPHDLGIDGGLVVTIRSASPTWPAAEEILQSLRILSRGGVTANDASAARPALPLVGDDGDE